MALSLDLRKRIVKAYLQGEGSYAAIAQRFDVGEATVRRLVKRHRTSGTLAPRAHAGGRPRRVRPEDEEVLQQLLSEHPTITQRELAQRFTEVTGRSVSQQTISRTLRRLGLRRGASGYEGESS